MYITAQLLVQTAVADSRQAPGRNTSCGRPTNIIFLLKPFLKGVHFCFVVGRGPSGGPAASVVCAADMWE